MPARGISNFEIDTNSHLLNNAVNLEKLRTILLDRSIITDNLTGPGNPGDFDFGAWHVLCHLAAGCAVYKNAGNLFWIEISHVPAQDIYEATVTPDSGNSYPLSSNNGKNLLAGAKLVGYVEGSSLGHISARGVNDPPERFNYWPRQDFDKSASSNADGGRVWEHWCTVRDIRPTSVIGTSVLREYLEMVSLCGGTLASIVARGREDYNHPDQLMALVKYGFISRDDALVDILPKEIKKEVEIEIYSADPLICAKAIKQLTWDDKKLTYYMFKRRINRWCSTEKVKKNLEKHNL